MYAGAKTVVRTVFGNSNDFEVKVGMHQGSASAYNNSHGKATLNSLDKASMTISNSRGLNAEPWCIPTFTLKLLLLP